MVGIYKGGRVMGKKHLTPSNSKGGLNNMRCFLQKNVHSTKFVTYFCEHVLPNLSSLTTPVEGLDIQLEVRQS